MGPETEKSSTGQKKEVFPLFLSAVVICSADLKPFLSHSINMHFPITRSLIAFFEEKSNIFMLGYRLAEKAGVEAL